jgi:hypothetical protein
MSPYHATSRTLVASYACPMCWEVHPGVYRIDWSRGLEAFGPQLLCVNCLRDLRREEATVGIGSSIDCAWGVTVLESVGRPEPEQVEAAA